MWRRMRDGQKSTGDALEMLQRDLTALWQEAWSGCLRLPSAAAYGVEAREALDTLATLRPRIAQLVRARPHHPRTLATALQVQTSLLQGKLNSLALAHPAPRQILVRALEHVLAAQARVSGPETLHAPAAQAVQPESAATGPTQVIVPTDLLHLVHGRLFPAERMMVVAGRRSNGKITLGAAFDVTGDASAGHVRAAPDELSRASIAMERSGTGLLGWFHSHPGAGPAATTPSTTDHRQHADWLLHFSPHLVSAVLVRDGYLRFFGTAVETGAVQVVVDGRGVTKEGGSDDLYRLQ